MGLLPRPPLSLERMLGRQIPTEYLAAVREVGSACRKLRGTHAPDELPLFDDLKVVVEENRMVREEDIWTVEGPWPSDHLLVGAEISGDKFSLWLGNTPPPVCRLLHETGTFEPVCTVEEMVAAVQRVAAGDASSITVALASITPPHVKIVQTAPPARESKAIERLLARLARATGNAERFEALDRLADAYDKNGRWTESIEICDQLIEKWPENPVSWNVKLRVLGRMLDAEDDPNAYGVDRYRGGYRQLFDSVAELRDAYVACLRGKRTLSNCDRHARAQAMALEEQALARSR